MNTSLNNKTADGVPPNKYDTAQINRYLHAFGILIVKQMRLYHSKRVAITGEFDRQAPRATRGRGDFAKLVEIEFDIAAVALILFIYQEAAIRISVKPIRVYRLTWSVGQPGTDS